MSFFVPGEVAPSLVPASLPKAHGWLYSWPRSDHPGYRQLQLSGALAQVASTTGKRWDQYIADVSTALSTAGGWTASIGTTGLITISGSSKTIGYPDRLGWLMGMGAEGSTVEASVTTTRTSKFVPPGGIPLMGLTWDSVEVERERELIMDRSRRQSGYVWGGARVWRWRLHMTKWAYEALITGWCLRGKVTLMGSNATAIGIAAPTGALTGHVLGLEGAPVWDGPTQLTARVTLLVAGSTA